MPYQEVRYEYGEDVAIVTLNRPDALNSLTQRMRAELADALKRASREARATVLTGAGRGFCAGQDLGPGKRAADLDLELTLREEYAPILDAMEKSATPILCAVNGPAAGAGVNIALAADVVIAARSASFLQAAARIGLMPDVGATWRLPRLVGLPRALGMSLFAEPIPAAQAAEWGMIWEVVDDASLAARAAELATRLARGPTRAYAEIRRAMRKSLVSDFATMFDHECATQGDLGRSRDFQEGVVAHGEKRAPRFEGR